MLGAICLINSMGFIFHVVFYFCVAGTKSCSDEMGDFGNKRTDWKTAREENQINEYETSYENYSNAHIDYGDYKMENPNRKIQALDSILGR